MNTKVKPLFYRLLNAVRLLFDFHKPVFCHLDCMDLVLENKKLLLISWDTLHSNKMCIRPGKAAERRPAGAGIYKLPANATSVSIILHNVWRSTSVSFYLRRLAPDSQIQQYIHEQFLAEPPFAITNIQFGFITSIVRIKNPEPEVSINPQVQPFPIYLNPFQPTNDVP